MIKYKYIKMIDIDFIEDGANFPTLCLRYITNPQLDKKVLMNSILMIALQKPIDTVLKVVLEHCLEVVDGCVGNYASKEGEASMAKLLHQLITKYPSLLSRTPTPVIHSLLEHSATQVHCAVAGNPYITLVNRIFCAVSDAGTTDLILRMLQDKKMHVGSYKQPVRHELYTMIIKVLQAGRFNQVQKVLQWIGDEKDPRNMEAVLRIYLWVIDNGGERTTQKKAEIWEILEAYYPISFEGDTSKHNISLKSISILLDECLCRPIFKQEMQELLLSKMGSPPINPYIPTFLKYSTLQPNIITTTQWQNLLVRTTETQYLQQPHDHLDLSDLTLQLLPTNMMPVCISTFETVMRWITQLTAHIYKSEDNNKYAGTIINIIQKIMKKGPTHIKHLLHKYIAKQFITHQSGKGQLIYKMGILVPVLQHVELPNTEEYGLLYMSLYNIFHQHPSDISVLVLTCKLLMAMGRVKECLPVGCVDELKGRALKELSNEKPEVAHAFCQFLIQTFPQHKQVHAHILDSPTVRVYGTVVLVGNEHIEPCYITNILHEKYHQHVSKAINSQAGKTLIKIINALSCQQVANISYYGQIGKMICSRVHELLQPSEIIKYLTQQIAEFRMEGLFLLRTLWRPYLPQLATLMQEKLTHFLTQERKDILLQTILFYNKSIIGLNLSHGLLVKCEDIMDGGDLLPISEGMQVRLEENMWPTLLHYHWLNTHNINDKIQLLKYLPPSILTSEGLQLLPHIMKIQHMETIAQLITCLTVDKIGENILSFCVEGLKEVDGSWPVTRVVALNRIFHHLLTKTSEKQNPILHKQLLTNRGPILLALEQKLLYHPKRLIRQSSRMNFSIVNTLK